MASVHLDLNAPMVATLATTLTRVNPGDGVHWVELSCDAEISVVYSDTLDDGGTVPATGHYRLPATVLRPFRVVPGKRILIAAVSGTPDCHMLGLADIRL